MSGMQVPLAPLASCPNSQRPPQRAKAPKTANWLVCLAIPTSPSDALSLSILFFLFFLFFSRALGCGIKTAHIHEKFAGNLEVGVSLC